MRNSKKAKIGIVKFFNSLRGYGIIKEQESDKEFVVHIDSLINSIKDNDLVEFEVERCKNRLMATRVRVI